MAALAPLLFAGCTTNTGPDSNTQVFQTPEQAQAGRKARMLADWQELAARVANSERPDVRTIKHPTQGFALLAQADGVEESIDLAPVAEKLRADSRDERQVMVVFLKQQMSLLDRKRLSALGFSGVGSMLMPMLANHRQTLALTGHAQTQTPITNKVVIDLNWVPVVRWPKSDAVTAIDPGICATWKVSEEEVSKRAMANLRSQFAANPDVFDTTELPGAGRYGQLRADVPAEFVVLPEFLSEIRKRWQSKDNLVLAIPSRRTVGFVESTQLNVLRAIAPQWQGVYTSAPDPLLDHLILMTDQGGVLYSLPAKPATAPASKPTTKPKPSGYITS